MACWDGGYDPDRFPTPVDKNFFCPICKAVLKDPVQCHNEHLFCNECLTQHLKNSKTCPVCKEDLTEETINKPSRIVTNYLDGLIINCDHSERGCTELIELGRLEAHSRTCNYKPVTCPNEECAKIMNLADLEQHTSEVCECRQVNCEECEKVMTYKKHSKHSCVISKEVHAMKASLIEVQDQVKELRKAQKEMSESVKNLKAYVRACHEIDCIVVVGGENVVQRSINCLNSVEMYSLANGTWHKLSPMQQSRASPTAHFYNGQVMVTGGDYEWSSFTNSIEYIQIHEEIKCQDYFSSERRPIQGIKRACPDEFSSFVSQLPIKCSGHKTAILNDHLWMVGGYWHEEGDKWCSDDIYVMPMNSPQSCMVKCQMPNPLSYHCLEIVHGNELLIVGGTTTGMVCDAVDTVLLYNTVTNTVREVHRLPFPMDDMATVKHGEDVIIIGGHNKDGEELNTVYKYNCKKNECKQLPGMNYKRAECAAVISGNKVFVMGGYNKEQRYLSSVECFDLDGNLDDQVWCELPSMNEAKNKIAAVLVPPCHTRDTGTITM